MGRREPHWGAIGVLLIVMSASITSMLAAGIILSFIGRLF